MLNFLKKIMGRKSKPAKIYSFEIVNDKEETIVFPVINKLLQYSDCGDTQGGSVRMIQSSVARFDVERWMYPNDTRKLIDVTMVSENVHQHMQYMEIGKLQKDGTYKCGSIGKFFATANVNVFTLKTNRPKPIDFDKSLFANISVLPNTKVTISFEVVDK